MNTKEAGQFGGNLTGSLQAVEIILVSQYALYMAILFR
jgi:hypothetical protein